LKTFFKPLFIIIVAVIGVTSCSRKKNKFVSRNFHAVTAEFNALYNGYLALESGRSTLNESYQDDYWEVLPVERMQISEDIILPGESRNENFTRAEEKAAKAIQKHSMNIEGKEHNPQMDEAYLLLGKARYFDQRFVPALEAFNYILYKYPASDKINQAKVWREKTNIRLDNDDLAIENLKRLLRQEDLKGQDLADATSMLAQAYINTKSVDSAITQLQIAAAATKNNDERGRYKFIEGQLYNTLGYKDSANLAFDEVIALRRNTPRIYLISAYLEKVKNFDYENGDKLELAELLERLETYRENRPYLDKIYHQIGAHHLKNESIKLAVRYFNKSLRTQTRDQKLKSKNYEIIGDISFDEKEYAEAGAYYDSTLGVLKLNSKPYRVIKRKRDNLEDVIKYEAIAKVDDSILKLTALSDAEKLSYFESYVSDLKEKVEAERKKQEALKRNTGLATVNNKVGNRANAISGEPTTNFYFYNSTTVAFGKNEFLKIWGDRPLEDNWRWSRKGFSAGSSVGTVAETATLNAKDDERFDPQFYISKIPSEPKVIDSISKERNFAYYQLGLIYKEKFKEYTLAKEKFKTLLKSNPEERLILPSKYNLYKIYELLGANDEASIAKQHIISKYPQSRYASILTNPEAAKLKDENSPVALYENLYKVHEAQDYETVISKSETYIKALDGDPIVPKLELLKATAKGRLYGFDAYKEALSHVAVTYANTPEGQQAERIQSGVLSKLQSKTFVSDSVSSVSKVIFKFDKIAIEDRAEFKALLDEVLENVRYYKLNTSEDVYDGNTTFVVVHGFENFQVAQTFKQILLDKDANKIKKPYFAVTSANYKILQIHKNLETYLNLNTNQTK
jgi:tetratricopeptide (TPR) repeat protein